MKLLLALLFVTTALLWLGRPYAFDLARYALWTLRHGSAIEHGTSMADDARIAWQRIALAPVDPGVPPLLLLHGGRSSILDWYSQIPVLAATRTLILVDTRGHGGSTLGTQSFSYSLFARDAIAVLDALGIERVDIAGWSDGGNTGLIFAVEYPTRLHRLVAISANLGPEGLKPAVLESIERDDESSGPSRWLHALRSPEQHRWRELVARVRQLWMAYPQIEIADLDAINAAVLVVTGEEDDIDLEHSKSIADALPHGRLVVLAGIGHTVPQSAPARTLELISGFLNDSATVDEVASQRTR